MRKHIKRLILVAVSTMMILLLVGISACDNTNSEQADGTASVRYAYLVSDQLHQYALPIGLANGWFEEEGIAIEQKEYTSAGVLTQAFVAGDFDIAVVGVSGAMLAAASGADLVMVASNNHGGSALVVDPSISSFADLEGRQVGHPGIGSNHSTLLNLLEQKYAIEVVKPTIKPTDMSIFAGNGEVDGIICYEPFPTKVVQDAGFKRLMGSDEILEDQQCCVIITSSKFIEEHPDVVQTIVKLNARATRFIIDEKDAALSIIAERSGHDLSLIEEAYENMIYPWPAEINVETSAVLLQGLIDSDKIDPSAIVPDPETWINSIYDRTFEQELIDSGYIAELESGGAK